jgi:HEAT repeats
VPGFLPLLTACGMAAAISQPAAPNDKFRDEVRQVRDLLSNYCHWETAGPNEKLEAMGATAFPAYAAILDDPKATSWQVAKIFSFVRIAKGDRRRFLGHAVRGLADEEHLVRLTAVQLLGEIGTPADMSPVVALLSDEKDWVALAAARALAAAGGPRELTAMDVWLRGVAHPADTDLRRRVRQCRDQLKQRLDAAARSTKTPGAG